MTTSKALGNAFKLQHVVNVKDPRFGAKGDGVTDDAAAINAAIAAVPATGGTVHMPPGNYKITAGIVVPNYVTLQGSGDVATNIEHHVVGGVAVTLGTDDTVVKYGIGLRDLAINMNLANTTGVLLRCTSGAHVENVTIYGDDVIFTYTGFNIRGGTTASSFLNLLENCYTTFLHTGYTFTDLGTPTTQSTFVNCSSIGNKTTDPTSVGISFTNTNGYDSAFYGGNLENLGRGVQFSATTQGTSFFGVRHESNTYAYDFNTNISGQSYNTIFGYGNGNTFTGSLAENGLHYGEFVNEVRFGRGGANVSSNVRVGNGLQSNTTGANNTTVGEDAGAAIVTGTGNVAIGHSALKVGTSNNNTVVGFQAAIAATSATEAVAIGQAAASNLTTAAYSTAVGAGAQVGKTGNNNIAIGRNAGTASSPSTIADAGTNQLVLGDSNIANAFIQVAWTVVSDERDKSDIEPMRVGLEVVGRIHPITYRMTPRNIDEPQQNEVVAGLSAQDLVAAFVGADEDPTKVVDMTDADRLKITETRLIPYLINSIQLLDRRVSEIMRKYP